MAKKKSNSADPSIPQDDPTGDEEKQKKQEESPPEESKSLVTQPEQALVERGETAVTVTEETKKDATVEQGSKQSSDKSEEKEAKQEKASKKGKKTDKAKATVSRKSQSNQARPRKRGKQYKEKSKLIDSGKTYSLTEAVKLVKELSYVKFDATVELHLKLGVDPKKPDQAIRGSITLPHGTGKSVTILVFAEGDKAAEAKKAGADYVGLEDLMEKISSGWLDFDVVVATPDVMGKIAKLGRILGTRGLMPNPKSGTVTFDLERIISELKAGRVEFKLEKLPLIHSIVGKISFTEQQIEENAKALIQAILKARPSSAKGIYLQSAYMNASMTPSIKLDVQALRSLVS